jgi:hypothetical protein
MAGKIFINYRRGDDPGFAGRLFDRLESSFPHDQLFMDVDSIPAGDDFVRVIEEQVAQCDVLLAVIGNGWLRAQDAAGRSRIESPDDFVRIEIEAGFKLGKRVIPVLVNGAEMPRVEALPESLKPLARRNAVRLTHERFKTDAQGLIKVLEGALEAADAARHARSEAQAAERRRAEEEAAALEAARREKERARQEAIAGLSPDQIAKAEELANWDFIKTSDDPQEFRDHLARFPSGVAERWARARLEALTWSGLGAKPSLADLEDFLAEFPDGAHAAEAERRRISLQRKEVQGRPRAQRASLATQAWEEIRDTEIVAWFEAFVQQYPESEHVKTAQARIVEIKARLGKHERSWRWRAGLVASIVIGLGLVLATAAIDYLIRTARNQEPAQPTLVEREPSEPPAPQSIVVKGVAQRAVLYEEDPAEPQGKRYVGTAIWQTEEVSPGPGLPLDLAVKASIEIPERAVTMTMRLRRNIASLYLNPQLSHTLEIAFHLPASVGFGSVSIPGILMKQAEQAHGAPLAGFNVKVTSGFFLVGLVATEANTKLLKERSWIDLPIVYGNRRRAILTLEKGDPGEHAFSAAFDAWRIVYPVPKGYQWQSAAKPGIRFDDPWTSSLVLTPSLMSMSVGTLGWPHDGQFTAALLRRPTIVLPNSFAQDAYPGMSFDQFRRSTARSRVPSATPPR